MSIATIGGITVNENPNDYAHFGCVTTDKTFNIFDNIVLII